MNNQNYNCHAPKGKLNLPDTVLPNHEAVIYNVEATMSLHSQKVYFTFSFHSI